MSHLSNKHKPDYSLIAIIFILVVFGLVMLSSASSVVGYTNYKDSYYFLKHQLLYGFLPGMVLFFILSRIDYKIWQKYAKWLFLANLILLILVFVPGIGFEYHKAKSWLKFGDLSVQPSEILKLVFLIYLSSWLSKNKGNVKNLLKGLLPFILMLGLSAGLVAIQPDIGTMSIIILIAFGVYFLAGIKWSHLSGLLLACVGIIFVLIKIASYRLERFKVFLNPETDPLGIGYHINQALLAIGSGGIFGLGFGHSRQKFEYLPEVYGDSIFAIVAEELGFIFAVFLLLLFLYFIFKILKLAKNQKNEFARFFCVGFAVWIGVQTLFNVGAMVSILPLTGVPMPFISYGGTALLSLLAGCGILVNITKTQKH